MEFPNRWKDNVVRYQSLHLNLLKWEKTESGFLPVVFPVVSDYNIKEMSVA